MIEDGRHIRGLSLPGICHDLDPSPVVFECSPLMSNLRKHLGDHHHAVLATGALMQCVAGKVTVAASLLRRRGGDWLEDLILGLRNDEVWLIG